MTCPNCGHQNRDSAAFCESCGSRLERPCASCGSPLRPGARFCDSCGAAVETAEPGDAAGLAESADNGSRDELVDTARRLIATGTSDSRAEALAVLTRVLSAVDPDSEPDLFQSLLKLKLEAQGIASEAAAGASIHAVTVAVQIALPDLRSYAGSDGNITLLFADMGDYDAISARHGHEKANEMLLKQNKIIRKILEEFDGFEVRSERDGFMVAFPSALEGVKCALALRDAFEDHNARHPELEIPIRAGLHTTEAVTEDEEYYRNVIAAAGALAASAAVGEILVSQASGDALGELLEVEGVSIKNRREVDLAEAPEIYEALSIGR